MNCLILLLTLGFSGCLWAAPAVHDVVLELRPACGAFDRLPDNPVPALAHPYAALRPEPFHYREDLTQDGPHAFLVGGDNPDSVIQNMTGITGVPLERLQARMYSIGGTSHVGWVFEQANNPVWKGLPAIGPRTSSWGYIPKGAQLRDLLLRDNQAVHAMGLTHQKIADPLLAAMEAVEKSGRESGKTRAVFVHNGQKYQVDIESANYPLKAGEFQSGWNIEKKIQGSPFNDMIFSNYHLTIKRLGGLSFRKPTLKIDGLTPHLIYRYGFYQGGDFRHEPQEIADFFRLTP